MLKLEYRAVALEAAEKSIVLLKNEDRVLPLKPGTKLGIFGTLAADRGQMTGAWAIGARPEDCISIVDALEANNVHYQYSADGTDLSKIASMSDVLIAAIGETKEESGEAASRAVITLKPKDMELVRALCATGKPVVAVLFNGRPLAIPELDQTVPAIVEAWHPGLYAGSAIMHVLYGITNPSGKLTTTFPASAGQCPMYYAHTNTGRPGGKSKFTSKYLDAPVEPLYPFGYGLSYTTYAYENLALEKDEDGLWVRVQVRNTGKRAGEEIVQCYVQMPCAKRVRPVRELKAFTKTALEPGETKQAELKIAYDSLGYYDWEMNWIPYEGNLKVFVGGNVRDTISAEVILGSMSSEMCE